MPDTDKPTARFPESRVVPKKRTRLPLVWIIPIVAAAAGAWIAITEILSEGPEITITFHSAEGLEAGKTRISYKGLPVGLITRIRLSADNKRFVATAKMDTKATEFLFKDTKFWVVRPRISGLNITGLGTLISGSYIGMQLGQSRESERAFEALESPPLTGDVPGRVFTLKTPQLGSIDDGTPVFFRQLQAGQVASYKLDPGGEFVTVQIFIQSPFDKFVTTDTRFWQASGIDMSLTANGLRVETESLMSILAGGIAFETPATDPALPPAEANTSFTLFNDREAAFQPPALNPQTYLLVFKESVRGLSAGAPVEFEGIRIGEVTEVRAQFDATTHEFTVRVMISVDPAKFGVQFVDLPAGEDVQSAHREVMNSMVGRGLRAQLKSGSLITGALLVAVDFFPDVPPATLDWSQTPVQIPTVPSLLEVLESKVSSILGKMDQMQFKEISDDLRMAIAKLDQTMVDFRVTLTNADQLLVTADQLIAPNSPLASGVDGTLQEVSRAARSLRVLADYLERHPEALIRGKTGNAK